MGLKVSNEHESGWLMGVAIRVVFALTTVRVVQAADFVHRAVVAGLAGSPCPCSKAAARFIVLW